MDDKVYLIYRVLENEKIFFGWTNSKKVLNAFIMQRNKKMYDYIKTDKEYLAEKYSDNILEDDYMINYIKIESVTTGEEVVFYSTKNELIEMEVKIQLYFLDLCKISDKVKNLENVLFCFSGLKEIYREALEVIGFSPFELRSIYPGHEEDEVYEVENVVFSAYDNKNTSSHNFGISETGELHKMILYSLESLIMVMRSEL